MLESTLKKYWGFDGFRPLQRQIIVDVLEGKDVLALLPTGGGKSLCYQLPAVLQEGICLVISPLIALMKDQVKNLETKGISAAYLTGGMHKRVLETEYQNAQNGKYKLLYVSPERAATKHFRDYFEYMKVSFIAVDEAHCISQWGYDFRAQYLKLNELREIYGVPIIALTATATKDVVEDIKLRLDLKKSSFFKQSFSRKNLNYLVINESNKMPRLVKICANTKGSGLIYVRNRRQTQEISKYLRKAGLSADFYHAGLSLDARNHKQEQWVSEKIRIMVCTNAFGMGIDKPNVRFVVHYQAPSSIEEYYQEAGRAGRDGKSSYCISLSHESDKKAAIELYQKSHPNEDFIVRTYNALCNHFEISHHSGAGMSFMLNITDFCKKFDLPILKTINALSLLQSEGHIDYAESMMIGSKVKFEMDGNALYEFQIKNEALLPVIKALLRSYGNIHTHFVQIHEGRLAKILKIKKTDVVRLLKGLHQEKVLFYEPSRQGTMVTFLQERLPQFSFKYKNIKTLFSVKLNKLKSMYAYLGDDIVCRENYLLKYFGESRESVCGKCDICRFLKKHKLNIAQLKKLQAQILSIIKIEPQKLSDILVKFKTSAEGDVLNVLRWLADNGHVQKTENKYYWIEPKK